LISGRGFLSPTTIIAVLYKNSRITQIIKIPGPASQFPVHGVITKYIL
jgi:hypothetical protein